MAKIKSEKTKSTRKKSVRIKADFKLLKNGEIAKRVRLAAQRSLPETLRDVIIKKYILKGRSPVEGVGRFVKYSDFYIEKIREANNKGRGKVKKAKSPEAQMIVGKGKRARPVNFKLTGKSIRSWFGRPERSGITIGFTSYLAEKFHYGGDHEHNARPLLPVDYGMIFDKKIRLVIRDKIAQLLNRIIKT